MWPGASQGHFRPILIGTILLICFVAVFVVYYKPSLRNVFPCNDEQMSSDQEKVACAKICDNIQNQTLIQTQTTQNTRIQPKSEEETGQAETLILIWMWPFGVPFQLESCSSLYDIKGCHLTDDRSLYSKAHGVLFHHRDIHDENSLPQMPRPVFQKWVWWNGESPANSGQWDRLSNLFNLTANYRRDSDIPVPYGSLAEVTNEDKSFELPKKDKLVCWIVSNWNENYRRVKYYYELKKHITIEAYGRHFQKNIDNKDYAGTMSSCKFYLSFENSAYKDYITEKLYNALSLGAVPVVLGPPRENYEDSIPGDSFIHVDDYTSPKHLAEQLLFLDKNETAYKQYFNWRSNFKVKNWRFGLEHACRSCDYIRKNKRYQVFKNLNKWYWG